MSIEIWPGCRYRLQKEAPGYEARTFQSQEELDAAGPGWEDNPEKLKGIAPKYPDPSAPQQVEVPEAKVEEPRGLTEKEIRRLNKLDLFTYARTVHGLDFPTPDDPVFVEKTKPMALEAIFKAIEKGK